MGLFCVFQIGFRACVLVSNRKMNRGHAVAGRKRRCRLERALEPGMKADLILIDLEEIMEEPWMSPELNIAEIFIHRAKGVHVNTAIVGGNVIMEDREFPHVDIEGLYKEVQKQAAKGISPEQQRFAGMLQKLKPYYHKWYQGWEKLDFAPFYIMNSRY